MFKSCPGCGAENADEARFCRLCGNAFGAAPPAVPAAEPRVRAKRLVPDGWAPWIVFGALALMLAAGVVGWLNVARSNGAPTFDSAPPPSVLDAAPSRTVPVGAVPVPPESMPADGSAAATALAASAPPTSDARPVPAAGPDATRSAAGPSPSANVSAGATGKAPNLARPQPQRPHLTPAPAAERTEAVARDGQARALPVARPVPGRGVGESGAVARQTVREQCAGRNQLLTGVCEARQCMRAEHAAEAVCRRIKAADDRRREQ